MGGKRAINIGAEGAPAARSRRLPIVVAKDSPQVRAAFRGAGGAVLFGSLKAQPVRMPIYPSGANRRCRLRRLYRRARAFAGAWMIFTACLCAVLLAAAAQRGMF